MVIRDCEEKEINSEDIVVGDLVIVRSGSRIPADLRILQANCLTIEVSEVTGQTNPVECTAEAAAAHVSVFDARNVAFKGSYCTEGDGLGIVIRTGKFTVLGGIANLHEHIPPPKSKLQTELRAFANFITVLAICMAVAVFLIGCIVARFENILDHFVVGFLVIIVANVPQGLPATVMSQLRIIARRMAQKNIYIKKLELIDELGAATVICADKSGTLTMNQMVVTDLWFNNRMVTEAGVDLKHPHLRAMRSTIKSGERLEDPLPDILTVMSVCNRAQFEHVRRSMRRVSTMRALQKSASEAMLSGPMKKKFTIVDTRTGQVSEPRRPTLPSVEGLKELNSANMSIEDIELATRKMSSRKQINDRKYSHAHIKNRKNDIFGIPSDVALVKYVELNASVEAIRQRYHVRRSLIVLLRIYLFYFDFGFVKYGVLISFVQCFKQTYVARSIYRKVEMPCYIISISIVHEIPFNSIRRWQLIVSRCLIDVSGGDTEDIQAPKKSEARYVVMMKGAPEIILCKCKKARLNKELVDIDEKFREKCQARYFYERFFFAWESLGNEGRRVIAFAQRHFNAPINAKFGSGEEKWPEDLVFLGMAAIMDPPRYVRIHTYSFQYFKCFLIRPETAAAISQCKGAGIKVFMITGDHPTTAKALATQIGLIGDRLEEKTSPKKTLSSRDWCIVTGEQLQEYKHTDWDALLRHKYIVFARTNPEQKLCIVQEVQRRGETVAVTGGGVNDASALAHANVGIAMGLSADIVLLDDNFASIVMGIEEGRLLFDNLRFPSFLLKQLSLAYTFAHLWPEVFPIMLSFMLGLPHGLSPMQILSIDLASEMPPAVSLAYEQPEQDIMHTRPRNRGARLMSKGLLMYAYVFAGTGITIGCIAAYLSVYW
uniref:Cation_ATPase_C domain-containing protein n=1 Tax=Heterorhabditis bacteriophora TaxID=37862 RepID=A0A1I7XP17_HETBA